MKHLRTLTLVLLLGALATILCAWIPALFNPPRAPVFHTGGLVKQWLDDVPDSWPDQPFGLTYDSFSAVNPDFPKPPRLRKRQGMADGVSNSGGHVTFLGDQPNHVIDIIQAGWPTHTMTHRGPDDARPLPLNPIWTPFALSTLVWSAVLFIAYQLVMIPFRIRRARRTKTNHCTTCGYELQDLQTCPECGSQSAPNPN